MASDLPGKTPVLFVNTATLPPLGADTWVHALLMRSVDRARFEVHSACAPGKPGAPTPTYQALSTIPEMRIHPVTFGTELFNRSPVQKALAALELFPGAASILGLARYIRRHGIRILHTSDRPRDALACVLLGRLTGAKSIVHVHVAAGDWMSPMLRWSMARADALIGVSAFVGRTLVDHGYPADRIHTVLNAIDVPAWDPDLDPRAGRRALGLPEQAPVLVSVARLFGAKGHAELLRALAIVRRELPEVRLLVVGEDYPKGSGFGDGLKALAAELGVAENAVFTGRRKDVPSLLAASDVYAMPSIEEPFGLVYAEAMAMRKPVVALDNGGTPEVVEHGKTGLLSPQGDVEKLAQNLLTLLRDPALRARMGERGRQEVEARFSARRMAQDTERLYATLLAG
jgi:glycosyltransferase involved in cell wall biosynthesis